MKAFSSTAPQHHVEVVYQPAVSPVFQSTKFCQNHPYLLAVCIAGASPSVAIAYICIKIIIFITVNIVVRICLTTYVHIINDCGHSIESKLKLATRLPSTRCLHFVTPWPWPLTFWYNIKWVARTHDGLSLWQVWPFWLQLHTDRRGWTLYSCDYYRRE